MFDCSDVSAFENLVKALEVNTRYVPALVVTGELMRLTGNFEHSRKCYRLALEEDPQQIMALKGLIKVCVDNGEVDEAVSAHFQTIRKLRFHPRLHENDFFERDYDYRVALTCSLRN